MTRRPVWEGNGGGGEDRSGRLAGWLSGRTDDEGDKGRRRKANHWQAGCLS